MRFEILPEGVKTKYFKIIQPLINYFAQKNTNPNVFSIASLTFTFIAALFYVAGLFRLAGLFVLTGGLCDTMDGNVARAAHRETRFGALLDSTLDRYSEAVMFMGIGLYFAVKYHGSISGILIPGFIYIAVIGSIMVSYVRARSESLEFECKVGLIQRPERVVLIGAASLVSEWLLLFIVLAVACLSQYTVIQRLLHISQSEKTDRSEK